MSGKTLDTVNLVGLLTMTPAGATPMLFITSTTESLKFGSRNSSPATIRIALVGLGSSANTGHETPSSRNAQRERLISSSRAGRRRSWQAECPVAPNPRLGQPDLRQLGRAQVRLVGAEEFVELRRFDPRAGKHRVHLPTMMNLVLEEMRQ